MERVQEKEAGSMPQHANTLHHHGYVEDTNLANALSGADRRRILEPDEIMHSAQEVAAWLSGTVRAAMGRSEEEVTFADEWEIWSEEAGKGETIVTGLNGGPTITAEAVYDADCDCERQLVPVPAVKKRR